jgi:phosphate transport system protein
MLQKEKDAIRQELALMAARVEEDLGKALTYLREGNDDLEKEVKESGKIVDALQLKIEDMALVLIATQQPVARDLREMIMVFKIASNLERIGDFGIHLVKTAKKLAKRSPFSSIGRIESMAGTGKKMLNAAFSSYIAKDAGAARKAALMDTEIDGEHKALTDEVLSLIKKQPELAKSAARLLRLSGFMERMGDHITAICEEVIYMIEGKHVELND